MHHNDSSFLAGAVAASDFFLFAKFHDELGEANTTFFIHDEGDWAMFPEGVAWTCIGMATLKPDGALRSVVAVDAQGAYWETLPANGETLTGAIPGARGLRSLRTIGQYYYAVGMGRRVFRRIAEGKWENLSATAPAASEGVIGFEDVDGFNDDEVYAVGWQSEIWSRQNGTWHRHKAPTASNLNAVCCASDGKVYVVGDNGALLQGRGDAWQQLASARTENLLDVAECDGQIFVITDFRLFKLVDSSLVEETEFADERPASFSMLEAGANTLLAIGPSQAFVYREHAWHRVD